MYNVGSKYGLGKNQLVEYLRSGLQLLRPRDMLFVVITIYRKLWSFRRGAVVNESD